jgi:hypothetical protein
MRKNIEPRNRPSQGIRAQGLRGPFALAQFAPISPPASSCIRRFHVTHVPPAFAHVRPPTIKPPERLGAAGQALWDAIVHEFDLADDPVGLTLLGQAACALDRAEELAAIVAAAGAFDAAEGKLHPAFVGELRCRTLLARCLRELGVTQESIMPVGVHRSNRPGKGRHFAD